MCRFLSQALKGKSINARLLKLCEAALTDAVPADCAPDAAETAISLLLLAEERGLNQLRNTAVDFLLRNYEASKSCEAFGMLSSVHVEAIAAEAVARCGRFERLLKDLAG